MSSFLTFDLGTTLFKVALFDDAGHLLDIERAAPPITHPKPGWAELDPHDFINTLLEAAGYLRSRAEHGFDDVAAVSFATQANSFTLLDHAGEPMTPLILWTDQRAMSLNKELAGIAMLPDFRARSGMSRFAQSLALAKVLWLRRELPDLMASTHAFCFLGDYLTYRLRGEQVSEAGVAGLSGALDIRSLNWRRDVLASVRADSMKMPPVQRAGSDLGPAFPAASEMFGLPRGCRVILGCLDQYAGAIGTGTVHPRQICETTGTVLAAVRCDDHLDPNPGPDVFQGPGFAPDCFFQMSFSSTSANLLEHYRNTLPDKPSFEQLAQVAASADADATIEPYEEDQPIERCFRHVRPEHSRGQIVRGIMRRVAQSLKQQVQSLAPGAPPSEIRSAGGGAKSDLWLQIKADLLGVPFVALECQEPTSLGAAILAAHGIGMGSVEEIARRWVRVRKVFRPTN